VEVMAVFEVVVVHVNIATWGYYMLVTQPTTAIVIVVFVLVVTIGMSCSLF
jgi:hypothetical protein